MRRAMSLLLLYLLTGCTVSEVAAPATVPGPPVDDLSTYTFPQTFQGKERKRKPVPPPEGKPTAAEKVFAYAPGTVYAAPVMPGVPLDIQLQPGERFQALVDGDRTPLKDGEKEGPWRIKELPEGEGELARKHITVIVTEAGLKNGFVITTAKRSYHLLCESVKSTPIRIVRWTYPPEPEDTRMREEVQTPLPPLDEAKEYIVGYTVTFNKANVTWGPRQVLDDGKKVYLIFPERMLFESIPLLRLLGTNGPEVVNSVRYLNVVVIDRLFARAELRMGTGEGAEIATITRGNSRKIQCPGDEGCPVWPEAAYTLARR